MVEPEVCTSDLVRSFCCIIEKNTSFSQFSSPFRSTNGYQQTVEEARQTAMSSLQMTEYPYQREQLITPGSFMLPKLGKTVTTMDSSFYILTSVCIFSMLFLCSFPRVLTKQFFLTIKN